MWSYSVTDFEGMLALAQLFTDYNLLTAILVFIFIGYGTYINKGLKKCISLLRTVTHGPIDIRKSVKVSEKINEALEQILIEANADRVTLYQYHNGSQNLAGIPFAKISSTNEVCNLGIHSLQEETQNIPSGMMVWWIKSVHDHPLKIPCIDCIQEEDRGVYEIYKARGCKSVYSFEITSVKGMPVGYVTIEYLKEPKDLHEDKLETIKDTVTKLGGCITCLLKEMYFDIKDEV